MFIQNLLDGKLDVNTTLDHLVIMNDHAWLPYLHNGEDIRELMQIHL